MTPWLEQASIDGQGPVALVRSCGMWAAEIVEEGGFFVCSLRNVAVMDFGVGLWRRIPVHHPQRSRAQQLRIAKQWTTYQLQRAQRLRDKRRLDRKAS